MYALAVARRATLCAHLGFFRREAQTRLRGYAERLVSEGSSGEDDLTAGGLFVKLSD